MAKAKRYYKYRETKAKTVFLPESTNVDKPIENQHMKCTNCGGRVTPTLFHWSDVTYVKSYKGKPINPWDHKQSYTPKIGYCPWCGKKISKLPVRMRIHGE